MYIFYQHYRIPDYFFLGEGGRGGRGLVFNYYLFAGNVLFC
jgi:hypothetical protein